MNSNEVLIGTSKGVIFCYDTVFQIVYRCFQYKSDAQVLSMAPFYYDVTEHGDKFKIQY